MIALEPQQRPMPPAFDKLGQDGSFVRLQMIREIVEPCEMEIMLRPAEQALDLPEHIHAVAAFRIELEIKPPEIPVAGKKPAHLDLDRTELGELPAMFRRHRPRRSDRHGVADGGVQLVASALLCVPGDLVREAGAAQRIVELAK